MSREFPNPSQQPPSQPSYPGFMPPSQPSNFAPPVQQPLQQGYAQPMQQPFTPQPQFAPRPPKKPRSMTWLWVIMIIAAFFIGLGVGASGHSNAPTAATTSTTTTTQPGTTTQAQPTTAPTAAPAQPSTLFSLKGNSELTTHTFTAPDSWTLHWTCTPPDSLPDAPVYINVLQDGKDTFTGDVTIDCKAGNTSGESAETLSGQISLHIISGIDWTVKATVP